MCAIAIGIWFVCGAAIVAVFSLSTDDSLRLFITLAALLAAVALPPVVGFFQPLCRGWGAARARLRERLMAEGVMSSADFDQGARPVELVEVMPGTERILPKTRERGFLSFREKRARFWGENKCWQSEKFRVSLGRSDRCGRCHIIWVCGLAPFRMVLEDGELPREFLAFSREGRSLTGAQRNTDMLAELGIMESGNPTVARPKECGGSGDQGSCQCGCEGKA